MPYKMKKPCAVLSCPTLAETGSAYCPEHKAQKEAEFKARSREYDKTRNQYKIYDADWRRFRVKYLKAHPFCCLCGKPSVMVDHIKALNEGGEKYDEANLQALCWSCHSRKTAQLDGGFRGKGVKSL